MRKIPTPLSIIRFCKNKVLSNIRISLSKVYVLKILKLSNDISIISNNCVGGVLYHDLGWKFLSPTINGFFMADDYLKYLHDLQYYNSLDVSAEIDSSRGNTVLLKMGDINIHFIHDTDPDKVISDWYRRRERINLDKIFVIASDRDGWNNETMDLFRLLPYKKCFFTVNKMWKDEPFSIYFRRYFHEPVFPNVISSRGYYISQKIFKLMRSVNE